MKLALGLVFAGVGIFAVQLAQAADLPMAAPMAPVAPPPALSWTGPYVGVDLGYMWGSTSVNDNGTVTETGAATNGILGGVLAGYNWQIDDTWVAGIEADASLANVHGTGVAVPPDLPNSYDLNWTANVRGRIGYLIMPDTLLYGAGGLALTDLRFTEGSSPAPAIGVTRAGWTVGAGIEHAFSDQLTGRLEYLYADYGTVSYGPPNDVYKIGFTANVVRAGLSWKF